MVGLSLGEGLDQGRKPVLGAEERGVREEKAREEQENQEDRRVEVSVACMEQEAVIPA